MSLELNRRDFFRAAGCAAAVAAAGTWLGGCGGGGATANDPEANAKVKLPAYIPYEGVTPDLAGNDQGVMPAFFKYPADPVDAITEKPGRGGELTAFVATYEALPVPMDKNTMWQKINDELGVTMKLQIIPSSDFEDKQSTLVASGDLPDYTMLSYDTPRLPELLGSQFQDLTEFLAGDAVKDYPMLAQMGDERWKTCVFNGGIYGLPIPRDVVGGVLYIRVDICKEKDLNPQPETFEDFKQLAADLTDESKSKWAFGQPTNIQSRIQRMMGAPPGWKEEGGKLTNENELETTREALARVSELVKAGYFHPDWAIEAPPVKDWIASGAVAILDDNYTAWPGYVKIYYPQYPEMDLDGMFPPKYDSSSTPNIARGGPSFSITGLKKSDDKEKVKEMLRVANFLAAPFGTQQHLLVKFGVEGVDHERVKGEPALTDKGLREQGLNLARIADAPFGLYESGRPEITRREHEYQVKAVPMTVKNPTTGLYSETNSSKGEVLSDILETTQKEIHQGRKNLDDWDEAVERWRNQGGDQMRKEFEEALVAAKKLGTN